MSIASAAALLDAIRQYRLLEPHQNDQIAASDLAKQNDPKPLAKDLVKHGWLTFYQVNKIFQGQAQNLLLGGYVLLQPIGEGGMGAVFKARHQRLHRIDAVKVINKNYLDNPSSIQRFQREARAAARLSHPNVITVYDAGEAGDTHFLAMQYVEGVDLCRLVRDKGPLPAALACDCIRQAALGLQHAHERGLVHRDIKPSNLLATEAQGLQSVGLVKVLDLGLARFKSIGQEETHNSLTETGMVVGTPDFISPEQAMNSREVDIRADIYSLGCTLYFLLTGKIPFPGETLTEKLIKHQLEEPEPIRQLRPDVPPGVAAAVRRMMNKRPEDRYQTPGHVATALEEFSQPEQAAPGRPASLAEAIAPAPNPALPPVELGLPEAPPVSRRADSIPDSSATVPFYDRPSSAPPFRRARMLFGAIAAGLLVMIIGVPFLLLGSGRKDTAKQRPRTNVVVVKQTKTDPVPTKPINTGKALPTFKIGGDPPPARVFLDRGAASFAAGKYEQAVVEFGEAIRLEPMNSAALLQRALAYNALGTHDLAIKDFTAALKLDPNSVPAYTGRGLSHGLRREFDRAILDFSGAIKLEPKNPGHYNNRGYANYCKGEYDKAISDLDIAIQLNPKYAKAYFHRSRSYEKKNDKAQAEADMKMALQLDPELAKLKD
jgi:serine/threonine-protein kinase